MADPTYRIRAVAPPDLPSDPAVRRLFYSWVVEIGLRVKDRELAQGLDREGKPLRAISPKTRKHRRSAMTPDGKGDPSAPALMPARALSRTRSLLAGRATEDAAIFYWRFDPFTGDSWGKVLAIHRRKGRDVIGLSPKGVARVRALAWERWRAYKRGEPIAMTTTTRSASPGIPQVGSYSTAHATFGIGAGAPPAFRPGQSTGGMTWPEWRKYLTQPNPATVAIPGRAPGPYNRVLAHVWGVQPPGPGGPEAGRPKAPPRPRGFDWSKAVDEKLPAFVAHGREIRAQQDRFWVEVATITERPEAELKAKAAEGLKAVVEASEPYVRVKARVLGQVLRDGRFKSQFETGTSEGLLDRETRAGAEARVMGVPPTIADARRPVYGYLGEPGFAGYSGPGEGILGGYGGVSVRLKRRTLGRATITLGDSLGKEDQLQASRAKAPSAVSLPTEIAGPARTVAAGLVERPHRPAENLRAIQRNFSYLEVQYHGGLPVDEIAEVAFPTPPDPEAVRLLAERKIPWRVIEPPK